MDNQTTILEMMTDFLDDMQIVSGRSENTIISYRIALNEFNQYMFNNEGKIADMEQLRARDILKRWLLVKKNEGLKAQSLNQRLSALSKFYKFLIGELFDVRNVTAGIPRFKDDIKDVNDKKFLHMDEAQNLLAEVKKNDDKITVYEQSRNKMMINLFLGCGLRIGELSQLTYDHINVNEEKIHITADIAKRNKSRVVDMPSTVVEMYKEYLKERKKHKNDSEFLFISRRNNKMSVNAIRDVVTKVSIKANGEKINPHGLRHTYGTLQFAAGQDPNYVSQQMGHSNITVTTGIYVHQANDAINRANNNPMFVKGV